MSALLLCARCLWAGVFLAAAAGKLLDLPGSRRALEDLGVPSRAAALAGPHPAPPTAAGWCPHD